jgi:hypothetical protein
MLVTGFIIKSGFNFAMQVYIAAMIKIEIVGWKKNFSTGDCIVDIARSELKKRLLRGVQASPAEIKRLHGEILAHQTVILHQVKDRWQQSVTRVLAAMGADTKVTMIEANRKDVFKEYHRRR